MSIFAKDEAVGLGYIIIGFILSMVVASAVFALLAGLEIALLATLKAIGITVFVIGVGILAALVLLAPYLVFLIGGVIAILDYKSVSALLLRILISIVVMLIFMALWTFIAGKLSGAAYQLMVNLADAGKIALPDSLHVFPILI